MTRILIPLSFGILGTALLIALGVWQVQRLAWKEAILADIAARIAADPVPLPATADPEADRYLPVTVTGDLTGEDLPVLASIRQTGAIWRLVAVMETGGRRIMVDRGWVRPGEENRTRPATGVTVTGNLHWPQEVDRFTPAPEPGGLWFARDVPAMAAALGTEPLLVVARAATGDGQAATPLPVSTEGIPNDHLQYALTWFMLAAVWAGMTAFLLWRITRQTR